MNGNKLNAVIIEDEKQARSALKHELNKYCPDIDIIGEAGSVAEGTKLLSKTNPQLIFLDIKLSDGTGFDLLKNINHKHYHIVFTTAYSNWAIEAIKFSALDYLLKPVDGTELKKAIDRALSYSKEDFSRKMNTLIGNESGVTENKKIAFQTSNGVYIYKLSEIIHCDADVNYTRIYSSKGELLIAKTLKEVERMLGHYGFLRIHQSHLINMSHVSSYQNKSGNVIVMSNGTQLPVSQRRRPLVIDALLNVS